MGHHTVTAVAANDYLAEQLSPQPGEYLYQKRAPRRAFLVPMFTRLHGFQGRQSQHCSFIAFPEETCFRRILQSELSLL